MKLTVALGTYNRAPLLDQTLSRMAEMMVPEGVEWELLIVNNCCTDDTDQVVARHQKHLPIRLLHENRPGVSHARNCVLENAQGEWVIFTDDDVLVASNWLAAYYAAFQTAEPNVAFFGGPVDPWFVERPDPELVAAIPMVGNGFCGRKVPESLRILEESQLPFTANLAVNLRLVGDVRFDPRLGPKGQSRVLGEDTEFVKVLLNKGDEGRWVPDALVQHYVDPKRFTTTHLRRTFFDNGRQLIRIEGWPPGKKVLGVTAWIPRDMVESAVAMNWWRLIGPRRRYYKRFSRFWTRFGMLYEGLFGPKATD